MAKKTQNSTAAQPETATEPQDGASASVIADASNPSGENGPDGTNTRSEESGDAAGSAPAELVKPLGDEPTEGATSEAATPSMPDMPPEAEASASGINSADASQGETTGEAGAAAGFTGGLTSTQADAIVSHILGLKPSVERRWFTVLDGTVRHNNVKVKAGDDVGLTAEEHRRLFAKGQVDAWELGDD